MILQIAYSLLFTVPSISNLTKRQNNFKSSPVRLRDAQCHHQTCQSTFSRKEISKRMKVQLLSALFQTQFIVFRSVPAHLAVDFMVSEHYLSMTQMCGSSELLP